MKPHNVKFDAGARNRLLFPAVHKTNEVVTMGGLSLNYQTPKARLHCFKRFFNREQLEIFRIYVN